MINSIERRWAKLVCDVTDDYYGEDKLLLRIYSAEEIIGMGFCKKNVDKIVYESSDQEVEEFFDKKVKDLRAIEFGGFDLSDTAGISTIGQLIAQIKRTAVIGYLNIQLSSTISELKLKDSHGK